MFRVIRKIQKKFNCDRRKKPILQPEEIDVTFEEDDSLSLASSLSNEDDGEDEEQVVFYQTHTFQQRFHEDHPPPGGVELKLSNLVDTVVTSLQPSEQNIWWDFNTDYDERNEGEVEDDDDVDDDDEEDVIDNNENDVESVEEDDEVDDGNIADDDIAVGIRPLSFSYSDDENDDEEVDELKEACEWKTEGTAILDTCQFNHLPGTFGNALHLVSGGEVGSTASESHDESVEIQYKPTQIEEEEEEDDNTSSIYDDNSVTSFEEHFNIDNDFVEFIEDAPIRPEPRKTIRYVGKCFDNVKLLSPDFFSTLREVSMKEKNIIETSSNNNERSTLMKECNENDDYSSPKLATMVHIMNPALFRTSKRTLTSQKQQQQQQPSIVEIDTNNTMDLQSDYKSKFMGGSSGINNNINNEIREGGLHVQEYNPIMKKKNPFETIRKKLASSFRSKTGKKKVFYNLSEGKKNMSKEERKYIKSLLPKKSLLSKKDIRKAKAAAAAADNNTATNNTMYNNIPRRTLPMFYDRPLSVLLLNPILKVFEIVLIDILSDTTIGDVLSKVREYASDESLSEQKYVSLCNRRQEIGAPMLPVSLLIDSKRHSRRRSKCRSHGKLADADEERRIDEENRREMEARLLVAVPEGSNAKDCQLIRQMLWTNPKIQRWWRRSDPFGHPDDDDDDDNDGSLSKDSSRRRRHHRKNKRQYCDPQKRMRYHKLQ